MHNSQRPEFAMNAMKSQMIVNVEDLRRCIFKHGIIISGNQGVSDIIVHPISYERIHLHEDVYNFVFHSRNKNPTSTRIEPTVLSWREGVPHL